MDAEQELAGYGESVAMLEARCEALAKESVQAWLIIYKVWKFVEDRDDEFVADFEETLPDGEQLVDYIEHGVKQLRKRRAVMKAAALAKISDRIALVSKQLATRINRGKPTEELRFSLKRLKSRMRQIKAADPMNTELY